MTGGNQEFLIQGEAMAKRKFDLVRTISLIFIFLTFILCSCYWSTLKYFIKDLLEWNYLTILIYAIAIILALSAYAFNKDIGPDLLIIQKFGNFLDSTTTCVTYAAGFNSSLAILKGFFIQKIIPGTTYFFKLSELDLWVLVLTMGFLMFYCAKRLVEIFIQITQDESVAVVDSNYK